ncbi:MAG: 3-phosphoserine/phosphohydroxythreonine transaminase [Gammaproteobacteria bacterium]|nr:MAG: 3-phosphoserine/phosphohydroxythreonine transaminase [Gammaproteobacteria bacterium]
MARVFNFNPGPATLPEPVLAQAQREFMEWPGAGMSVMEMSHRGKEFVSIAEKTEQTLRELLSIPARYKVLFLQGGATTQFAAVPMNLRGGSAGADYVDTGHWSKKAIKEAGRYCTVNVAASGEADGYHGIPPQAEWKTRTDAAYLHYTPNETIGGVEFHWIPESAEVPLVADMSSNILSAPVDVSRFGVIYAGAQKNIGISGLTLVIVREDLLGQAADITPTPLDYAVQVKSGSMINTPPTFAWYMAGLTLEWVKERGGVEAIAESNKRKAGRLYQTIDGSDLYSNPVEPESRSRMNVPFLLGDSALDATFLSEASEAGLVGLKGHRAVGGMRASIYNAMSEDGIDTLVDFMQDFEQRHG